MTISFKGEINASLVKIYYVLVTVGSGRQEISWLFSPEYDLCLSFIMVKECQKRQKITTFPTVTGIGVNTVVFGDFFLLLIRVYWL
ncbi:hypothetical protein Z042_00695 [Chania multitudinisentens RB-25]|uniref:Uncharacterized protein n=1 Tax=Chania multitudinisentens RB-25 TaxID=1441930 RepID=W0LJF2_9GAMM|nr:hypothetical protein Z042_00695 [Chania multitudinisentens RB-25]